MISYPNPTASAAITAKPAIHVAAYSLVRARWLAATALHRSAASPRDAAVLRTHGLQVFQVGATGRPPVSSSAQAELCEVDPEYGLVDDVVEHATREVVGGVGDGVGGERRDR